jgi:nicotinamidase-related amidase
MASPGGPFRPALIVVDMQNDFCPPVCHQRLAKRDSTNSSLIQTGSLAVAGGRDIAALINHLISLPGFLLRVATQDWHPISHVSFASNHPPPDNKPFEDYVDVRNWVAGKQDETTKQRLWPVHCVQGTSGAEIIDEIDVGKIDLMVKKGIDERVEMYSVFADSFGNMTAGSGGVSHDLATVLKEKETTHVYVVGLAGDYCVKATAIDAAKAGFESYVVEEGTRCVSSQDWDAVKGDLYRQNVMVVSVDGEEVGRVRKIATA